MKHYTPEYVCTELGISKPTLQRWRKTGKFKPDYMTPGGHSRYSEEQIANIKNNKKLSAQPEQFKKSPSPDAEPKSVKIEDLL